MWNNLQPVIQCYQWKQELKEWLQGSCKCINPQLAEDFIRFFELAFTNTRYPEEAWFGIHKQAASLVVGGNYLAAVRTAKEERGIWLLVARDAPEIEGLVYSPAKSTQESPTPLNWAYAVSFEIVTNIIKANEFWQFYAEASEKIFNSHKASGSRDELQQRKGKKRLSSFWKSEDIDRSKNISISELTVAQELAEAEGYFDPKDIKDARERINASIVRRQGQSLFRQRLLKAYNSRCVITDCDAEAALEAAHIIPYKGTDTNHPSNGLLLRADIHTLYDLHLLSIDPETKTVLVAPNLANSCYEKLVGKSIKPPKELTSEPNTEALEQHYKQFIANKKLEE